MGIIKGFLCASLALAGMAASRLAHAQDITPNLTSGAGVVVTGNIDLLRKQERAFADAVNAYRDLSAYLNIPTQCDLRQLCADERYTIQVSNAYVQLLYNPTSQPSIKMASFPLKARQVATIINNPLPPEGTPEYSYVKMQKSLLTIGRRAATDRQRLYSFPDAQDNPFLPWPPPAPSSFEDVSSSFQTRTSLGEIASQIRGRITTRGYDTLRYFSVPGGFAMATDVERVGRSRPVAGTDRWTTGKRGGGGGIMDYWHRLLAGENDRFRVFVFIITDSDVRNDQDAASADDLRHWRVTGRPSLSRERASALALPGTRIWLYAYEFNASHSKGAELVQNERDPLRIQDNKNALGLP